MAECADRNSAAAESVPGADTSLQVLRTPAPRAGPAEPHNIYPHTTAGPACGHQLWARLQGEMETLVFMELYCFQTEICHKFINALIELSEARERHVHSTPPLLIVGIPEFGARPWNKLPHSLLLDMRSPVQSCCAPETLSGAMI